MVTLGSLSDEFLVDCYGTAVKLKLDEDFIHMLAKEVERRNLHESKRLSAK